MRNSGQKSDGKSRENWDEIFKKENEKLENMTEEEMEEKEDDWLFMLMQQSDRKDTVSRDEIMAQLKSIK